MAEPKRTSQLDALATVTGDDVVMVVDSTDLTMGAAGTNKRPTAATLAAYVQSALDNIPSLALSAAQLPFKDVLWVSGVVGDGIADDGAALNTFLTANAGENIALPPGVIVRTTVPIEPPTGTRLSAYGAKLVNDCAGTSDRLLICDTVSDIIIEGLELDGDKAGFASATEQRHGIYITNSSDIRLFDVTSHNNKGDGIYIGHSTEGISTGIRGYSVVSRDNHRNNMTIVHAQDVKFYGSSFNNASGTSPETGVDIEPNDDDDVVEDIQFYGCTSNGNAGRGFWVIQRPAATAAQRNIGFHGCTASGNTLDGFRLNNPVDVRIDGGSSDLNGETGVYIINAGRNVYVDINSSYNGHYGLLHSTGTIDGMVIGGVYWHNGSVTTNTYDGVLLAATSGTSQATILPGIVCGGPPSGARQRYGLRVQTAYTLKNFGGYFPNNVTAATLIATTTVDGYKDSTAFRLGGELELDGALNHDGTTAGFFAVTPTTRPTAYTQTYATADKTHAAPTAAALTVTDGAGTNDGTIGAITADASVIAAVQELADQINKLVADLADSKQLANSVIDDLQALGLFQ